MTRASIQSTIALGEGRRLAVVRVETAGGLTIPDVVDLSARDGFLGTIWERTPFGDEYTTGCTVDAYCLYVFQPHAVTARIEPTTPDLASHLEGIPLEVPLRNGVAFTRNLAQVRAITGTGRLVARDVDGDEVPQLPQRLNATESMTGRTPAPGVVVVEE